LQIGGITYNDHGIRSVVGQSDAELEADDFYFDPTFLRGSPGQKLTVTVKNEGKELHNFSLSAQQLDKDIPPDGKIQLEVTFPPLGALRFFCKYHSGQGMNGQLLAGDATPQPVSEQSGGY
jgi:plastocyanin